MDTWHLTISQQDDTAVCMLAELTTAEPAVAAAALRAVADRLDPPQSAYRRGDHLRAARVATRDPLERTFEGPCPDCTGDRHTYQPGRCALRPPWNGTLVVDAPGDRLDAPDAVLSPAAARRVRRPGVERINPNV